MIQLRELFIKAFFPDPKFLKKKNLKDRNMYLVPFKGRKDRVNKSG